MKYKRVELLILTASKEINDYDVVVIGQGIPMAAGAIAKLKHAPNSIILTEAGMIDLNIFQNMEDVGDPGCTIGYSYSIDLFDVFTTIVNRGYCDVCILGAAQLDKYGNINSSAVGGCDFTSRRNMKLSGSGGANEFAGHSNRTILTIVGGKFVKKLDYLTSPGWLNGGDYRRKAGLPGGPSAVVSQYGLFRFHEITKEMYLAGIFPDTSVEDVRKIIPWDLKIAEDHGETLKKIAPPPIEDLEVIRNFDPFFGIGAHEGRVLQSQVLPLYYARRLKNE